MKFLHLISRKQAILSGFLFYVTEKPCKRGHFSERFVSNRQCKDCWSESTRSWYKANREAVLIKQKNYGQKNAEMRSAQRKIRYAQNSAYELRKNSEWRKANKGLTTFHSVKYQTNKKNRTPNWLTEEQVKSIATEYELATWCTKVMGIKYHVDHIVPLQGKTVSGLHVPWNLRVIPALDNQSKSNKFSDKEASL